MSTKKKNVGRKPLRKCVCCDSQRSKSEMLRIVISGRNTEVKEAFMDETGRQHGRGAYICKREKCIDSALKTGLITEEVAKDCLEEIYSSSLKLLSLAMKSGSIAAGEYSTEEAIKKGEAVFVIIAGDASDNTAKKFKDKCSYYEVPFKVGWDKETLGKQIGKAERSVIAVKSEDFGKEFFNRFGGNE